VYGCTENYEQTFRLRLEGEEWAGPAAKPVASNLPYYALTLNLP